jgi:protein-S-isoprenylcysteine O-methyltransferase Ste14
MVALLPSQVLWRIPSPWVYITGAVQMLALVGLIIGVFHTDVMAFIGLRQLVNPDTEKTSELVTVGLYGIVRHPLYFFGLVLIWLTPYMTDLILAFNIAASLYLILGTIPEERKLVALYGREYEAYQKKVPRIIPGLKF